MNPEPKPSGGAQSAAMEIAKICTTRGTYKEACEEFAAIIDREAGLPELLEALEEINRDAWSDDPTRLRAIARHTDRLLAAHKRPENHPDLNPLS